MGYTHYYNIPAKIDAEVFETFVETTKKIIKKVEKGYFDYEIKLADGHGETEKGYTLNSRLVSFNGLDDAAHETLYIERESTESISPSSDELIFNFCKTNRKSYDVVVVAVLTALKYYIPQTVLSSDGKPSELEEGAKLASEVIGKKVTYKKD